MERYLRLHHHFNQRILGETIPRDIIISCRLNEAELKAIIKKTKQTNRTLSAFIRAALLGKSIVYVPEVRLFTKELNHIGNNLNQLTVLAHKGHIETVYLNETLDALNHIYKELTRIRR